MVGPPPVRNKRGIRLRRIAHPDPDPVVFLDQRIGAHACLRWDAFLPRDLYALPILSKKQPVIAATQVVSLRPAHRERQLAVAAAILQPYGLSTCGAIEDNGFIEKGASEKALRKLAAPGGDVPGISEKHAGILPVCASP